MIKVLLSLLMIRKTYRLVVARFALRVLYRKQTKHAISTQLEAWVNSNKSDLPESSTEELRFAKRIKSNEATKLKLRKKQASVTNLDLSQNL